MGESSLLKLLAPTSPRRRALSHEPRSDRMAASNAVIESFRQPICPFPFVLFLRRIEGSAG
jgi:hypothetical protein